jgi:hypothetical protein
MPLMLSLYLGGVLGFAYPKEQAENFLNRRRGLVSMLPLPLAAIGGEETRGAATLLSSMGTLMSFLTLKGWCSLSHPKVCVTPKKIKSLNLV